MKKEADQVKALPLTRSDRSCLVFSESVEGAFSFNVVFFKPSQNLGSEHFTISETETKNGSAEKKEGRISEAGSSNILLIKTVGN